ncbi:2'-5' RNA ligase family protein [Actinocorallia longicatena]|uniref:2'-5' RNA ligase family protein n=1 Tax=Actinocorallia longicatena TaxID=111803 RepID=A0ABP6QFZ0_9ACTN
MVSDQTIGVSLAVPDPYGADLQRQREAFGDPLASKVPAHVTLVPPTPVAGGDMEAVLAHLTSVAAITEPFRLRLRGTGTFRPISPVVFVSVVEGISPSELLQEKLRRPPLERELLFPYHPHVTVAHNVEEHVLDRAFKELAGFHAVFDVEAFWLYEHGADEVWRPVRPFPLMGGR